MHSWSMFSLQVHSFLTDKSFLALLIAVGIWIWGIYQAVKRGWCAFSEILSSAQSIKIYISDQVFYKCTAERRWTRVLAVGVNIVSSPWTTIWFIHKSTHKETFIKWCNHEIRVSKQNTYPNIAVNFEVTWLLVNTTCDRSNEAF
jgi:hypothetical protein